MKVKSAIWLFAGVSIVSMPLLAHHSFMAEFDQNQRISMEGVVTAVQWQNPHTFFYVDVADKSGRIVNWTLNPGALIPLCCGVGDETQ